jgi:hypothetical protein
LPLDGIAAPDALEESFSLDQVQTAFAPEHVNSLTGGQASADALQQTAAAARVFPGELHRLDLARPAVAADHKRRRFRRLLVLGGALPSEQSAVA